MVDADGLLLVDSARFGPRADQVGAADGSHRGCDDEFERLARSESTSAEETFLYRLASFPVRLWRRWVSPPGPPLETDDFYAGTTVLRGAEVLDALDGRYGAATRISTSGQRSVTLYSAIPVFGAGQVAGAVLASQSTYRILVDLYDLRLDVFILFLGSVAAAAALSLLAAATITVPIRRLRGQARSVLDARGRLAGRFEPSKRRDEVGDLSRSLGDLSRTYEAPGSACSRASPPTWRTSCATPSPPSARPWSWRSPSRSRSNGRASSSRRSRTPGAWNA